MALGNQIFLNKWKLLIFWVTNSICWKKNKNTTCGLPQWISGKESACQCRRHRFDPWPRKNPHVSKQLSPCASTIELVLWSLGTITTKPMWLNYWNLCAPELVLCSKRSHRNEKPLHRNDSAAREKPTPQQRPDRAESTNFKNYIWKNVV